MLWGAAQRMTCEAACPPFRRRVDTTATTRSIAVHGDTAPRRRDDLGRRGVAGFGSGSGVSGRLCYSGSHPLAVVMLTCGRLILRLPFGRPL